jgi:hypothetical protein
MNLGQVVAGSSVGHTSRDVGFWVTVALAKGEIREPRAALSRSPRSAEMRLVQEEKAKSWWRGTELNCRHHDFQS